MAGTFILSAAHYYFWYRSHARTSRSTARAALLWQVWGEIRAGSGLCLDAFCHPVFPFVLWVTLAPRESHRTAIPVIINPVVSSKYTSTWAALCPFLRLLDGGGEVKETLKESQHSPCLGESQIFAALDTLCRCTALSKHLLPEFAYHLTWPLPAHTGTSDICFRVWQLVHIPFVFIRFTPS